MKYLIDPPSDFAPLKDWEAFLADMRKMRIQDPLDPGLRDAEREAEAMVKEKSQA